MDLILGRIMDHTSIYETSWLKMVPMMEYHIPQEPCSITPSHDHSNRVCFNDSIGTSKWFSQETKGQFEVKINHQHIDMI